MSVNGKNLLHLVQHGINPDIYKPIDKSTDKYITLYKKLLGDKQYDFVLFFNSRNMNRKRTSNIILAYRLFCDSLSKEKSDKCLFMMKTEPVLDAGTDLPVTVEALCPMYPTKFIFEPLMPEDLNVLYNISDATINVSSNEGFGLSCAESIMAGTPVIVNVTGGLQDQIGQTKDDGSPIEFDDKMGTNNLKYYTKHGCWAKPIWPSALTLQGSPITPYIFDDLVKVEDIADAIMYWYLMDSSKREQCGLEGRRWAMNEGNINSKHMCNEFIKAMDFTINNFKPRKPFDIHTTDEYIGHKMPNDNMGFTYPKIDIEKVKGELYECTKTNR